MTTHGIRRPLLTVSALLIAALTHGPLVRVSAQARSQGAAPDLATVSATRAHVEALASDRFDGRAAGSEGAKLAADYLVDQLQRLGARPLPGQQDLRFAFQFTGGVKDGGSSVALKAAGGDAERWTAADTVQGLSFSDSGQVSGQVVFAGYGLVVPESGSFSYDSYGAMNVKDKIVVVLRYYPEDADEQIKTVLARYSGLRYKALAARERGARALVVITGPRSPNAGTVAPMTFDAAVAGSGIVAASVGGVVADALFKQVSGKSLDAAQQALDTGNPHVAGFEIPGVELTLDVKVTRERQTDHNVVAYLPPQQAGSPSVDKPYVMLGAHYDHLGHGGHGSSLARREEMGSIHHGADDNASGVAAVLAAGAQLAGMKRDRGIVLAFWSGEELGLLGSAEFTRGPPVPIDQIAAYVNLDMVGRMRDNKLAVQAAGTSSAWPRVIEQTNVPIGFDIQLQNDPNLPTDTSSFNAASIPCLSLFTGSHPDYHRPTDVASAINVADLDRVARFTALLAQKVANLPQPPDFIKVRRTTDEGGGDRAALRVFTGTIPDYTSEVQGLKLGGVIDGGPAAKAGLKEGDVIVEFAGRKVANIYDYMYALEGVKIGVPVKVVYLRGGNPAEVTLTPEARK
ncbi:MAG: M20/M25/M40 family metallo-hydrolase [Acidobacteria bacterium]|nr:M20/M25/M40 family metallo-hydrolase [Acidobacteriota bacterium]MBI3262333.1 M20/M25/M40 family metallo-hydrolase [Acidobacteriota bacterium]